MMRVWLWVLSGVQLTDETVAGAFLERGSYPTSPPVVASPAGFPASLAGCLEVYGLFQSGGSSCRNDYHNLLSD